MKNFLEWLGKASLTSIAGISHYPLLIFAIVCLILYGGGYKKAGKYVPASIIIYYLLQCAKAAVK